MEIGTSEPSRSGPVASVSFRGPAARGQASDQLSPRKRQGSRPESSWRHIETPPRPLQPLHFDPCRDGWPQSGLRINRHRLSRDKAEIAGDEAGNHHGRGQRRHFGLDIVPETTVHQAIFDEPERARDGREQLPHKRCRHLSQRGVYLVGALLLERNDESSVYGARYTTLETLAPMSEVASIYLTAVAN